MLFWKWHSCRSWRTKGTSVLLQPSWPTGKTDRWFRVYEIRVSVLVSEMIVASSSGINGYLVSDSNSHLLQGQSEIHCAILVYWEKRFWKKSEFLVKECWFEATILWQFRSSSRCATNVHTDAQQRSVEINVQQLTLICIIFVIKKKMFVWAKQQLLIFLSLVSREFHLTTFKI